MSRLPDNFDGKSQHLLPFQGLALPSIWRPIHYLGSKLRLTESIGQIVSSLCHPGDTVCDLFAGSGTAALALSSTYSVIAADIQEYSRVLCSALLKPAHVTEKKARDVISQAGQFESDWQESLAPILDFEEEALGNAASSPSLMCDLTEHGLISDTPVNNGRLSRLLRETASRLDHNAFPFLVTRYFGGSYFSYRQALQLDSLLQAIESLPPEERNTYLAAILSTASTIVSSIGKQFAQPMRPRQKDGTIKPHVIKQMCRDRNFKASFVFWNWLVQYRQLPTSGNHQIIRDDYREVLRSLKNVSVVYADPPYTRDHYSRFYHVLETISLRDAPSVSRTNLVDRGGASRGIYRQHRHQSPFCIKSKVGSAFTELFEKSSELGAALLVSYSPYVDNGHPRLMTIEQIQRIARTHYREVIVESAKPLSHSKLNRSDMHLIASRNAELFIICRH